MNFQRGKNREDPEINFIPLIDVLLVIVIFLVVTTTYARQSKLQINLPSGEATASQEEPKQITVVVDAKGAYAVNDNLLAGNRAEDIQAALKEAAGDQKDPIVTINADAQAQHQSVIKVMEAASKSGYARVNFTIQKSR